MNMELEKELVVRVFLHKTAIVKGALAQAYITEEKKKGGVLLADVFLEQQAMDFANSTLAKIMCAGELDNAYEEAWGLTKDYMPDNFSIMGLGY